MAFLAGAFFAKLGISLALSLLASQFNEPRRRIAAQKRPNEIKSDGEASYAELFVLGEAVTPGAEVYRGAETYDLTAAPYSAAEPGKARAFHRGFVLSEGECEAPSGFFLGDDEWSVNDQRTALGLGARFRSAPVTEADGSILWRLITSRGASMDLRWKLAANGQQSASLTAAVGRIDGDKLEWSVRHRLEGHSWAHLTQYQPPIDALHGGVKWPDSLQDLSFLLKGKKLRIPGPGAPSAWPVAFTRNAAAIRFWEVTEFEGVPARRIDLPSVRNAYRVCNRKMDLGASHLADIRRSYQPTTDNTAPTATSGNSYPPGGSWSVDVRNTSEAMPYVWVQFQTRTGSVWGAWGGVRRFRSQLSGGPDNGTGRPTVVTERMVVGASKQVNHDGDVIYTVDPTRVGVFRPKIPPTLDYPPMPQPPPDPTDPDTPDDDDDDMIEIPPDKATGDPDDPYLGTLLGDAQFMVYSVNGLITGDDLQNLQSLRQELDFAWAGAVVDDGGRLFFRPGEDSAPVANFNDLTGETIYVETAVPITERVNAVTMELAASRVHRYGPWTMPQFIDSAAHERDGRLLEKHLGTRGFITSPAAAEVLMGIHLRQARSPRVYTRRESVAANPAYLRIRPGDRVTLNDGARGLNPVTDGKAGNDQGVYCKVVGKLLDTARWTIDFALIESPNGTYEPQARRFPRIEPNISAPGALAPDVDGFTATESSIVDRLGVVRHRITASWSTQAIHRTIVQWRPVVPGGTGEDAYTQIFETVDGSRVRITATPDWSAQRQLETGSGAATITGLQEGVSYEARAKHVSRAGFEGAWGDVASVFIIGSLYPTTPTNVRGWLGVDGYVRASWVNPEVALPDEWRLEFLFDEGTAGELLYRVRGVDVGDESYDESTRPLRVRFTDAAFGTFRIYPVLTTLNQDGTVNSRHNLSPFELSLAVARIDVPGGLSGTPTETKIALTWDSVTDAATYHLRWKRATQSFYPRANVTTGLTTEAGTISSLSDGTAYDIQVRAVAANATGRWSTSIRITTVDIPELPGVPRSLTLLRGSPASTVLEASCISPADDGGAPIIGYTWRFAESGAAFTDYTTTAASRSFTGLDASSVYGVLVAARNSVGRGPFGSEALATTGATQPVAGFQYFFGVRSADGEQEAARRRFDGTTLAAWFVVARATLPGWIGDNVPDFNAAAAEGPLGAIGQWTTLPSNGWNGCPAAGIMMVIPGGGIWAGSDVQGARGARGSGAAQVKNIDTNVWAAPANNFAGLSGSINLYYGLGNGLAGVVFDTPAGYLHTGFTVWVPD